VAQLSEVISEVTRAGSRYDLTGYLRDHSKAVSGREVLLTAMEISLARQGETIALDDKDFAEKFKEKTKGESDTGATMNQFMYIIDRVGIVGRTAAAAPRIYTARAYRLKSRDQVPIELEKGRPIVTGIVVYEKWWSPDVRKTGLVEEWKQSGVLQGGMPIVIVGYDPGNGSVRFLTHIPDWGQHGLGTLTEGFLKDIMYSIEAAEAVTWG
jgi:hypothetical protein